MENPLDLRFGYHRDEADRLALDRLVQTVFGFSFEPWYDLGRDTGDYTPFSYFEGDVAVANVAASPMHLVINGQSAEALQIGTVATIPSHRGRGLMRALLERAHEHWRADERLCFLFANDSVLELYQRFGYRRVTEFNFHAPAPKFLRAGGSARRLNLGRAEDVELLCRLADARAPVSMRLGVVRHTWLLLFHARVRYPNNLLYIEPLDVAVASVARNRTLYLVDVIAKEIPDLSHLYPYIGSEDIERVVFQFQPDRLEVADLTVEPSASSHVFIKGDFTLENQVFRFPETSQA